MVFGQLLSRLIENSAKSEVNFGGHFPFLLPPRNFPPLLFRAAFPPANSAFSVFRERCLSRDALRAAFDSYAIFLGLTFAFFADDLATDGSGCCR